MSAASQKIRQAGLTLTLEDRTASNPKLVASPASLLTDSFRNLIRENKAELVAELRAKDAPDVSTQSARPTASFLARPEGIELSRLVRKCGEAYHFTEGEFTEAMEAAIRDPENALTSYRAIALTLSINK